MHGSTKRIGTFLLSSIVVGLFLCAPASLGAQGRALPNHRPLDRGPLYVPPWAKHAPRLESTRALPSRFMWNQYETTCGGQSVTLDLTTPVRDQGQCGSCWAFATVGLLEAMWKISLFDMGQPCLFLGVANQNVQFSPQDLIACSNRGGDSGTCAGGHIIDALEWVQANGITSEDCMTYTANDPPCTDGDPATGCAFYSCTLNPEPNVTGCGSTVASARQRFIQAQDGVLVVQADANGDQWKRYIFENGPIATRLAVTVGFDDWNGANADTVAFGDDWDRSLCSNPDLDQAEAVDTVDSAVRRGWHAVVITGWDDNAVTATGDRGAWIVRNSWTNESPCPACWSRWSYFMLNYESLCVGYNGGSVGFSDASAWTIIFHHPDDDLDGDGVPDVSDNCASVFNPPIGVTGQPDADEDYDTIYHTGLAGDACDPCTDSDHDGFKDPGTAGVQCSGGGSVDNCPTTSNSTQADNENDGIGDKCDDDDDNDGVADGPDCKKYDPAIHPGATELCDGLDQNCDDVADEGFPDLDGDGTADCVDPDDDGDYAQDSVDNCPILQNASQADSDQDGLGDACDPCPDDPVAHPAGACDSDQDGIIDGADNCEGLYNPLQQDHDQDARGDACDACPDDPLESNDSEACDQDGDGMPDHVDNCLAYTNLDQKDTDGDGKGDPCDPCVNDPLRDAACDDDDDGIPNVDDKCNGTQDPGQLDGDGDGVGDSCDGCPADADSTHQASADCDGDADGVPDVGDDCPAEKNADQADGDDDGVGNACDACPNDPEPAHQSQAVCDDDGDGISNWGTPVPGAEPVAEGADIDTPAGDHNGCSVSVTGSADVVPLVLVCVGLAALRLRRRTTRAAT